MNQATISSYDAGYVALSFLIAFVGSVIALTAARRIPRPDGRISYFDLLTATLALGGIGVWTMHFVGMAALRLDLRVGYATPETLGSLLVVTGATCFSLLHVARAPSSLQRLLTAGASLGLGVGVMHYLGMYGMRFGGYIQWSSALVALSLIIAVVAATAALWLVFNTRRFILRLLASLVMAVAVCAMHYTGMAAAEFICTTNDRMTLPQGLGIIVADELPLLVLATAMAIAVTLSIDLVLQKLLAPRNHHL